MTATVTTHPVKERLACCPACKSDVLADAYAVRCRGDWYHVRCAIERDERERAVSEQAEQPKRLPEDLGKTAPAPA
jgi:hypothetical protein